MQSTNQITIYMHQNLATTCVSDIINQNYCNVCFLIKQLALLVRESSNGIVSFEAESLKRPLNCFIFRASTTYGMYFILFRLH